jgi:hypothetical protein
MDFTLNFHPDPSALISADGLYILFLCTITYLLLNRYEMGAIRFHFVFLLALGLIVAKLIGGVDLLQMTLSLIGAIGFFHLWFPVVTFFFTLSLFLGNLAFKEALKIASLSAAVVFGLAWFFTE